MSVHTVRDLGGRIVGALQSPLYGSGYSLLVNAAGTTAVGFVYWAAAAHLYSAQTLGRNSALVSALLLVSNFAQLSLHSTLPRFLPQAGRSAYRLVTYSYAVSTLAALAIGVAVVTVLPGVNSNWRFVGESAFLAVLFAAGTVLWGIFNLEDAALVGLHRSVVVPVENTVYGVAKLLLLLSLATVLPTTGIFFSWVIPLLIIIPAVNWLIFRRYLADKDHTAVATGLRAREVLRFASIDYVGAVIGQGSWNVLPLLVLSALGAAANGNFYIAFTLASGLTMVTANFSYSMLAEGAKAPHRLPELTWGVLVRCGIVTVPAAALMAIAAGPILSIYGPGYAAHASALLGLLALYAIPTGLVTIAFSLDRLAGRVGRAALTQGIRAALILGGSWLLMGRLGINGVGLACLGGSLVVALARLPTIVGVARRREARTTGAHRGGRAGSGMLPRLGSLKLGWGFARMPELYGRAQALASPQSPASPVAGPAQAPAAPRRIEDADTGVSPVGLVLGKADIGAIPGAVRFEGISNVDIAARRQFDNADTVEFERIPASPAEAPPFGGTQAPDSSAAAGSGTLPGVARGGITARHASVDGDAHRLWPAAIGYMLIAALALIVFVRHLHRFGGGSAWGIVYLIILGMVLLAGAVGLARGLSRDRPAR